MSIFSDKQRRDAARANNRLDWWIIVTPFIMALILGLLFDAHGFFTERHAERDLPICTHDHLIPEQSRSGSAGE